MKLYLYYIARTDFFYYLKMKTTKGNTTSNSNRKFIEQKGEIDNRDTNSRDRLLIWLEDEILKSGGVNLVLLD